MGEYGFDSRKQAGSSTECSWAKWLLIIANSTPLLWALTGRGRFSIGCVGCLSVCAGEWAWHTLLALRLPLKGWNQWWGSITWGHPSCVQHRGLSFSFSILSLFVSGFNRSWFTARTCSAAVHGWHKFEGWGFVFGEGANTPSQRHIVQGSKP